MVARLRSTVVEYIIARGRRGVCAAVVLAAALAAAAPAARAEDSLRGVVVCADGQRTLAHVLVTLLSASHGAPLARTESDEDGVFSFSGLRPARYTLQFSRHDLFERQVPVEIMGGSGPELLVQLAHRGVAAHSAAGGSISRRALGVPEKARKEFAEAVRALARRDREACIARVQAALRIHPQCAAAYAVLGTAYLGQNQTEEAVAAFKRALELDAALPDANFGLGVLRSSQRDYAAAEKLLLRAAQARPGNAMVQFELGQLYLRRENFPEAEAYLRLALALREDHPRTHLLLINALAMQDKLSEALAAMDAYLKRFPADPFAAQVRAKRNALAGQLAAR